MSYSVYFFGIDSARVAREFAVAGGDLLKRVEQHLRDQQRFDDEEIRSTSAKAARIIEGKIPPESDAVDDDDYHEYFDALCWIAAVVGERINVPSFNDFRRLHFLKDIGAWVWLMQSRPIFAVPACREPPPQVGFLSASDIRTFALPRFPNLPPAGYAEAAYARQELQEVMESLAEDGLDLLAVLM
jgi:hypothetical protein